MPAFSPATAPDLLDADLCSSDDAGPPLEAVTPVVCPIKSVSRAKFSSKKELPPRTYLEPSLLLLSAMLVWRGERRFSPPPLPFRSLPRVLLKIDNRLAAAAPGLRPSMVRVVSSGTLLWRLEETVPPLGNRVVVMKDPFEILSTSELVLPADRGC